MSWVKPDNLHYTLRFLGEVGEDGARRAARGGAPRPRRAARAFDATLGALGAFPNARRARVIWLGMTEGGEPLVALARALERALARRGFDREADKPFSAHLTLGRVREPGPDWTEQLAAARAPWDRRRASAWSRLSRGREHAVAARLDLHRCGEVAAARRLTVGWPRKSVRADGRSCPPERDPLSVYCPNV